jgi:hypothetical protein
MVYMFGVRVRGKMKINRPITDKLQSSDSLLEKAVLPAVFNSTACIPYPGTFVTGLRRIMEHVRRATVPAGIRNRHFRNTIQRLCR